MKSSRGVKLFFLNPRSQRANKKVFSFGIKKGWKLSTPQAIEYSIKYHLEGGAEEKYILRAGGF
jgi:hypothetical protein